jgi:predicted nucleotidyltransferase
MPPPELRGLALAPRHLAELRALLQRHVPDAEVWAFGSRVTGSSHEGSDLDLVLRNAQDSTQPVAGLADLREALQSSALPMLVEAQDWSHLPAAFHAAIEQAYAVLQMPRLRGQDATESIGTGIRATCSRGRRPRTTGGGRT